MALTPAQLASTWTWLGTGVTTLATRTVVKEVAKTAIKVVSKST